VDFDGPHARSLRLTNAEETPLGSERDSLRHPRAHAF
jgi:hypothetical protein